MIRFTVLMIGLAATAACGQVFDETRTLQAPDGAHGDALGTAVAVSNGVAAVGTPMHEDAGVASGAVYLFDAETGAFINKLLSDDGEAGDLFGASVAMSGGVLAVGATGDDDRGANAGAVYLFDVSTGKQISKLLADDGAAADLFGSSVAIFGDVVVAGSPSDDDLGLSSGSAYQFDLASGEQVRKLLPTDGATGDRFGQSVAISGGFIAVGAPFDDDAGNNSGSAYLFSVVTGGQLSKLRDDEGSGGDFLGWSVAIGGGTVAVGAIGDDDLAPGAGSVKLFALAGQTPMATLLAGNGVAGDQFGSAVAITGASDQGGVIVVGAQSSGLSGSNSGAAYLFDLNTSEALGGLRPSTAAAGDQFGAAVAGDGGTIVAGSPFDDDGGEDTGSAFVFVYPPACVADFNGDGAVNILDVSDFALNWINAGPGSDFNEDGLVNILDVVDFISVWSQGCP